MFPLVAAVAFGVLAPTLSASRLPFCSFGGPPKSLQLCFLAYPAVNLRPSSIRRNGSRISDERLMVPAMFHFTILHAWREAWGQRGGWLVPQQPRRLGGASEEIRAISVLTKGGRVEDQAEVAFVVCLGVGRAKPCCEGRARTGSA